MIDNPENAPERQVAQGREQLIQGAVRCIADLGMSGATVREIARYSDVTPGLIRHHFGNKNNLLAECYRHLNDIAMQRMRQSLDKPDATLTDSLRETFLSFFPNDMRKTTEMRFLITFWSVLLSNQEFADIQREINAGFHTFLVDLLTHHLGPRDNMESLANGIQAIAVGLWLECCLNPSSFNPETAMENALNLCEQVLVNQS